MHPTQLHTLNARMPHRTLGYQSDMAALVLALFIVAAVLFAIETFRARSLLAGGLCAMAVAFAVPGLVAMG